MRRIGLMSLANRGDNWLKAFVKIIQNRINKLPEAERPDRQKELDDFRELGRNPTISGLLSPQELVDRTVKAAAPVGAVHCKYIINGTTFCLNNITPEECARLPHGTPVDSCSGFPPYPPGSF
jgi:hypothetical protein